MVDAARIELAGELTSVPNRLRQLLAKGIAPTQTAPEDGGGCRLRSCAGCPGLAFPTRHLAELGQPSKTGGHDGFLPRTEPSGIPRTGFLGAISRGPSVYRFRHVPVYELAAGAGIPPAHVLPWPPLSRRAPWVLGQPAKLDSTAICGICGCLNLNIA